MACLRRPALLLLALALIQVWVHAWPHHGPGRRAALLQTPETRFQHPSRPLTPHAILNAGGQPGCGPKHTVLSRQPST